MAKQDLYNLFIVFAKRGFGNGIIHFVPAKSGSLSELYGKIMLVDFFTKFWWKCFYALGTSTACHTQTIVTHYTFTATATWDWFFFLLFLVDSCATRSTLPYTSSRMFLFDLTLTTRSCFFLAPLFCYKLAPFSYITLVAIF